MPRELIAYDSDWIRAVGLVTWRCRKEHYPLQGSRATATLIKGKVVTEWQPFSCQQLAFKKRVLFKKVHLTHST